MQRQPVTTDIAPKEEPMSNNFDTATAPPPDGMFDSEIPMAEDYREPTAAGEDEPMMPMAKMDHRGTCQPFSLLLTLSIVGCLIYGILDPSPPYGLYVAAGLGLVYFFELAFCSTTKYIFNREDAENALVYIDDLKTTMPTIQMGVRCYHNETRTRTVHKSNSNGHGSSTETETYTEKVYTHSASQLVEYSTCQDQTATGGMESALHFNLIRLRMHLDIEFADNYSQMAYEQQREQFKRTNDRDMHQDYSEARKVRGYKKRKMVTSVHTQMPIWMNGWILLLSAITLTSWLFRFAFQRATYKLKIRVVKRVRIERAQY